MKFYGDIERAKQDLKELSNRVGFEITKFKTEECSNPEDRSKIIKAFADTIEEIPKAKLSVAKKWIARENYWAQHICEAKIKTESQ